MEFHKSEHLWNSINAYFRALWLAIRLSVMSLGDRNVRAVTCVYVIEVAHAHVQNTPLELFSSTPGLWSPAEAVERDLLVVQPVIRV